jgi:cell division protein FtsI (penicillin-binding protein 3)
MTRSVLYTTSPLLASKTPLWRSKSWLRWRWVLWAWVRAAYVQVFGNDFFKRQGLRFARTLSCRPIVAVCWIAMA